MSEIDSEALKQAIEKDEDERTDEDWALLAEAYAADKSQVEEVAKETGAQLTE